jgi:CheY-like chemotaxis protein
MSSDPEKVLVLAKEATARSCLRRTLEALRFDVGEAANSEDAMRRMRRLRQSPFDDEIDAFLSIAEAAGLSKAPREPVGSIFVPLSSVRSV